MEFIVLKPLNGRLPAHNKYVYLIEDNWNDFGYQTMYDVYAFNEFNKKIYLGKIKIASRSMSNEKRMQRVNLANEFNCLGEDYFSLGQDTEYYERLKHFSDEYRKEFFTALRDIAYDSAILDNVKDLHVTKKSLLREVSLNTAKYQFHRIAHGGEKQVPYEFVYEENINKDNYFKLNFKITPHDLPTTNIHVIIGRNGVGKTRLIKNIIYTILGIDKNDSNSHSRIRFTKDDISNEEFDSVLHVSFSAFDNKINIDSNKFQFQEIGLSEDKNGLLLEEEFVQSFIIANYGERKKLLRTVFDILNYDPIFQEMDIEQYLADDLNQEKNKENLISLFKKLSSGHKVIVLAISQLVHKIQEKTLVLIDEPEGHLHPPLLAAFIRALSEILTAYNGAAIIATHSPVILQEVPSNCVWKLSRYGQYTKATRPQIETFGEDISTLLSDVFRLEIEKSGFRNVLSTLVDKNPNCSYEDILKKLNGCLGNEGRFLLQTLIYLKKKG